MQAHPALLRQRAVEAVAAPVIRYDKEEVFIVSEEEWRERCRSAPTLGALLANYARAGVFSRPNTCRSWNERVLGQNFGRGMGADPHPLEQPRRGRARRV